MDSILSAGPGRYTGGGSFGDLKLLSITPQLAIPEDEFQWTFVRSGGPGGQNVNKVASKAVLRWPVVASPSLPGEIKQRFLAQQRRRITADGHLLVASQRFRDQERNRQDCLDKLRELILQAATRPKVRRPTKPTRGSRERRLQEKSRRAAVKSRRQRPVDE
jgi:ribosome-associated protein